MSNVTWKKMSIWGKSEVLENSGRIDLGLEGGALGEEGSYTRRAFYSRRMWGWSAAAGEESFQLGYYLLELWKYAFHSSSQRDTMAVGCTVKQPPHACEAILPNKLFLSISDWTPQRHWDRYPLGSWTSKTAHFLCWRNSYNWTRECLTLSLSTLLPFPLFPVNTSRPWWYNGWRCTVLPYILVHGIDMHGVWWQVCFAKSRPQLGKSESVEGVMMPLWHRLLCTLRVCISDPLLTCARSNQVSTKEE